MFELKKKALSIKNSAYCCQSVHTVGILKDHRGGQITTFYLSELPGTEPGASHTEACRRYRSRWGARHKAALRRVLDRLCVSPERTCVWVSACESTSVLPLSVSPLLLFTRSFTICSEGRAQAAIRWLLFTTQDKLRGFSLSSVSLQ